MERAQSPLGGSKSPRPHTDQNESLTPKPQFQLSTFSYYINLIEWRKRDLFLDVPHLTRKQTPY